MFRNVYDVNIVLLFHLVETREDRSIFIFSSDIVANLQIKFLITDFHVFFFRYSSVHLHY